MYSVVNRVLKIYSPLSSSEKAASTSLINHPLIKKRLLQRQLQHYLRPARVCGRFNLASSKTQTDSPRREHSLQVNPWPGTAALGPSPTTPATARAMPWRTSHVLAAWPPARPLLPRRYLITCLASSSPSRSHARPRPSWSRARPRGSSRRGSASRVKAPPWPRLGSCASSERAWRLWAAHYSTPRKRPRRPTGRPATASVA